MKSIKSTTGKSPEWNIPNVDLKQQYESIKSQIQAAINQVFQQSWFILGKQVQNFEKEFSQYCETSYGIGVASGTEALYLALKALDIGQGDEVITAPNTAVPTALAISMTKAKPVFTDIDAKTYTLDPNLLKKTLSKKTKAIIPVHLYGQMADMTPLMDIAHNNKIPIIEDACQAHGALYKGKKAGSLGLLGCFSFYPSKNLGAYGDGGMIVSKNELLVEKLKKMRNCGFSSKYHCEYQGINSRLDELHAAILRVKLKYLDKWNQARRERTALYNKLIKNEQIVKPTEAPYAHHIYHLYVIRSPKRDELQKYLAEKGIQTFIHYPAPIHLQPAYKNLKRAPGSFPIAEQCAKEILSLPMYPELAKEQIEYVCEILNRFT
jgi:dTDP-4-amino-4,6-dideoxygalactose transaminase